MPRTWLLIDGYNLMHAVGLALKRYGPGELEKRRERFLNHLAARLSDDERSRTTIVFDAGDPTIDAPKEFTRSGMRICFSPADSDADSVVEDLIARHSAPKQLRVVSSDRRLQTAATRRRAAAVRSEEFVAELDRRSSRPAAESGPVDDPELTAKQGREISTAESEHWLSVFGDAATEAERALKPKGDSPPGRSAKPRSRRKK